MNTEIINVRVSEKLLNKLDSIIQEKAFNSRSEAIRYFIREHITEQKTKTEAQK